MLAGAEGRARRVTAEKQRFEQSIENRQKEKEELRTRYADYRKRYTELRAQQASGVRSTPPALARDLGANGQGSRSRAP